MCMVRCRYEENKEGQDVKVYVFAQNQVNYHPHYPKGFNWHFIETKAIKYDYYSIIIM